MELIQNELKVALQHQQSHEEYNSRLYLSIAGFLRNLGLDRLSEKFFDQYKEEAAHAIMIFDLLTDLGASVSMKALGSPDFPIEIPMDIAKRYLEREIETTNSLNEIKKMAEQYSCPVVEERMREMISLQQTEYKEATAFMDIVSLFSDWKSLALWSEGNGHVCN